MFLSNVKIEKSEFGKKLDKSINKLSKNKLVGKSGWFGEKYANGTFVASAVVWNEYGTSKIPARPFIRPTLNSSTIKNLIRVLAARESKKVIVGEEDISRMLLLISEKFTGETKKTISKLTEPALKESTIYNRLHRKEDKKTIGLLTKPLVDSGIMLNTMTSKVENE